MSLKLCFLKKKERVSSCLCVAVIFLSLRPFGVLAQGQNKSALGNDDPILAYRVESREPMWFGYNQGRNKKVS